MSLKKLCAYPGCFRPTDIGERYCELHKKTGSDRDARFIKERELRRISRAGNSSQRGYGSKWRTLRNRYIAQHPYCVECLKRGVITMATDVDHITPHRGNHKLLYDEENLQSLCKSCHSRKTAREDGGFGKKRSYSN